VSVLEMVMSL